MRLSDHFTLAHLTFSETAVRHGIDQSNPPDAIIYNLRELAYALEDVERLTGEVPIISSGYRSPEVNKLIPGSSLTSAHTQGLAADFRCPKFGSPLDVCRVIAGSIIRYDQLIHEYSSWCHMSILGQGRRMLLTKQTGTDYLVGLV